MNKKRLKVALALAFLVLVSQFRHYGGPLSLNEGVAVGPCGYEYRGEPGFFCLTGE